jgi:hypothetical protein
MTILSLNTKLINLIVVVLVGGVEVSTIEYLQIYVRLGYVWNTIFVGTCVIGTLILTVL